LTSVLGQGGHWAPVAGFDGAMQDTGNNDANAVSYEPFTPEVSMHKFSDSARTVLVDNTTREENAAGTVDRSSFLTDHNRTPSSAFRTEAMNSLMYEKQATSHAHVFVGKKHGGGIYVDDPAFLAEWSVEAMKLIRKQLNRAGNGHVSIPFFTNWLDDTTRRELELPRWARDVASTKLPSEDDVILSACDQQRITITDVPLMTAEVSALLDVMEEVMEIQRYRRLEQLRAPSWLRSNWYVVASLTPVVAFAARRIGSKGYGKEFIKLVVERVVSFFRERVVDPVAAM
jgi:hypothetical protein